MIKKTFLLLIFLCIFIFSEQFNLSGTIEAGFVGVMDHKIKFSKNGTYFDYDKDGGQNVLFFAKRFSLDLSISKKHIVTLLYQPLLLESTDILRDDLVIDNETFEQGTPMRFTYGFPFYRISYMYDFKHADKNELALGISFQIRNATISFESLDGEKLRVQKDIGPVPIIKFRYKKYLNEKFFIGTEADGFYAPISYLNGSDTEVTGAILDASLRAGMVVNTKSEVFFNSRYLGGGAVGESRDERDLGDGYVKNWLHFLNISVGFTRIF